MSYNYTLKYRNFDQLLDSIRIDFIQYDLTNYIEPQQLIKIAKKVNYDLGLRIMMTKEAILDVEKGRVKLPDDFYVLNFALLCNTCVFTQTMPQGTNIQEIPVANPNALNQNGCSVAPYKETNSFINTCTDGPVNCQVCFQPPTTCGCAQPQIPTACSSQPFDPVVPFGNNCIKPRRVFMNCKGDCYELVQMVNTTSYYSYSQLVEVKILENPETIDCNCPNLYRDCPNTAWIQNGWIYTNFPTGKLYINYQGTLEDDDGNLLIPDHDMINEYYEYAIKQRILENLIMNDEPVGQKLQLVEARLRVARTYALSIVNTPNFSEMKKVWQMNRNAQYTKYYNMFKSNNLFLGWNTNRRGTNAIPGF
jgi:hypothetical protein